MSDYAEMVCCLRKIERRARLRKLAAFCAAAVLVSFLALICGRYAYATNTDIIARLADGSSVGLVGCRASIVTLTTAANPVLAGSVDCRTDSIFHEGFEP